MDPNVTIITPDKRDGFGQYAILPGHTHCHEFQVPFLGSIHLSVAHILPNSQDFSIDYWFSKVPLDQQINSPGFAHGKMVRMERHVHIFDSLLRQNDEDDRVFMASGSPLYLNVKNLQNRHNAYQAEFTHPDHHNHHKG